MKKVIFYSLLVFTLFGCKKSSDTPTATFTFKANGVLYDISSKDYDIHCEKFTPTSANNTYGIAYAYDIKAWVLNPSNTSHAGNRGFIVYVESPTLITERTYTHPTYYIDPILNINHWDSELNFESFSVTFTKITSNSVSGTFTGVMFDIQTNQRITISEGNFSNVPIREE
jgi:hypothetical protein